MRGSQEVTEAAGQATTTKEKIMVSRRSAVALAVFCALAISAIPASGASAAKAFTCVSSPIHGDRFGPHCLPSEPPSSRYSHVSFADNTPLIATNEDTASETTAAAVSVLTGSLSGVVTELQCTGVTGTGEMENTATQVKGTGTLKYTGCTVVKPAGKSCKVNGETVETKELAAETESATVIKFNPVSGETFANVKIESCTVSALNNTFPVTGSVKGTVTGGTTTTTEAGVTEQGTLKFGGNKAGLSGAYTDRGDSGDAIVLT